jgi:hypothetical protein
LADQILRGLPTLPTPKVTDAHHSSPADMNRNDPGLRAIGRLLATPRATDGTNGGPNQRGSAGDLTLPSQVARILPTPTATPYGNNRSDSPNAATRPSLDTLAAQIGESSDPPSTDGQLF